MCCWRKDFEMNNRNQLWILLILGVIISLFATANSDAKQTHQIRYRYIELGTLGGDYSWTTGINNWGQVVGVSELGNGAYRGFLWTAKNKKMKNLGSLDDDLISSTWAINDTGLVVGFSLGLDSQRQAILWDDKGMHPLETLGGTDSDALGINRHGTIVGYSLTSENLYRAAVWDSDGISALDTPEGLESWAWSINTKGDIVGAFITSGIYLRAVVWSKKGVRELGTLGGDESEAFSINDKGDAVGWCSLPENLGWHACLWDRNGDILDLGTAGGLNSAAYSINEHGQVVGAYFPGDSLDVTRAFIWSKKDGMRDLETLADLPEDVSLASANSINDFGWIAGTTVGDTACLLIPYTSDKDVDHHKPHSHHHCR
jgi:probable HAF family extracellular repeat protein